MESHQAVHGGVCMVVGVWGCGGVEDECVGTEVNVCLHHVCMCMCVDIRNSLQSSIDGNSYTN